MQPVSTGLYGFTRYPFDWRSLIIFTVIKVFPTSVLVPLINILLFFISNYLSKFKSLPHCDFSVIEGAGGLFSPLALDGFNIDLIKKIKAPTILVAKDEIGVINNVMLSLNILRQYKIKVIAVILNRIDKIQPTGMNNYKEIGALIKTPLIQILNKSKNNQKEFKKLIKLITG